ncbi:MAG: HAD family hydrolase, partial [Candidatus Ranarchaeia archaeon]
MRQLAVFDTEGVVVNGVWLIALFRRLGLIRFFRFALFALLYKLRIRDFKQTILSVYSMAKGVTRKTMTQAFWESRRIYGVRSTIDTLHDHGTYVAITSSGVPDFILKNFVTDLGADVGIGLNLEFEGDVLTGKVSGDLLENDGKARIVRKLQKKL